MTLQQDLETARRRTLPGSPAMLSLTSGTSLPGAAPASHPQSANPPIPQSPAPRCPCGNPVDPDLLELRSTFPSLSPDLCTSCYSIASREDEARAREEMDLAEHRARLARLDVLSDQAGPKVLATDLGHRTFNAALHISVQGWNPDTGKWLFIHGAPGSCKTRVAALLAKRLILDGRHVAWTTAGKLQTTVEELHSYAKADEHLRTAARARLRVWTESGILFIDDLGKNTWSPALESRFFELIDHRETRWLPTVITSNRPLLELLDDMSKDRGGPIIGRIQSAATGWILRADPVPAARR
jgi:DNA replication protein DnaC